MKNIYGLNALGELTNIKDATRNSSGVYFCIQCNDELIVRKGEINRHHFSHKNKLACNYETYLHKIGKLKFFSIYKNCLENNIPFYIESNPIKICTTCNEKENHNFNCNMYSGSEKIDLTTIFDKVYLEKNHNDFIADVLLKSTKRLEVIFIEICVTHQCEDIKIKSGNRIIEIKVEKEVDIDFLDDRYFHKSIANCRFYNFKVPTLKKNFIQINECDESINLFSIFKSGKAVSREISRKNLEKELSNPNVIYCSIENYNEGGNAYASNFYNSVVEASKNGIKFKNCYACRFWGENYFKNLTGDSLFCKRKKILIKNSNLGYDCDKFWRIE